MKIGIIGAMDSETGAIVHALTEKYGEQKSHKFISNAEFNEFETEFVDVVVCTCGCGKVNAAITTTLLIHLYDCDYIVNVGCCGTMSKDVRVGDFLIPHEVMQYDYDTTQLGEPRYAIPGTAFMTKYQMSEKLRKALILAVDVCGMENKLNRDNSICLATSGDTFVGSKKQQRYFGLNKLKPHVVDMETAAIAHACWVAGVQFAAIRHVTDGCDATVYVSSEDKVPVLMSDIILKFLTTKYIGFEETASATKENSDE